MKVDSIEQIQTIFNNQTKIRWKIAESTAEERIERLKKLRNAIESRKEDFYKAVWEDYHRSAFEAFATEVFPTLEELDHAIKHLKTWIKEEKVEGVIYLPGNSSYIRYEPKGHVLIMAPWNYPFQLFLVPIISAVAAGNVIMAKPSNKIQQTSAFLASLIEDVFPPEEVCAIEGPGAAIGDMLLTMPFDHVFFTGSVNVGAHIGEEAEKIHADLTLELGGQSPCIIMPEADINDAATKIAWGKFLNAGQTCITSNHIFCHTSLVHELSEAIAVRVKKM